MKPWPPAGSKSASGEITIDGFYDNVLPPTELEKQAPAALSVDEAAVLAELDLETFDAPPGRTFYERLSCWPTQDRLNL